MAICMLIAIHSKHYANSSSFETSFLLKVSHKHYHYPTNTHLEKEKETLHEVSMALRPFRGDSEAYSRFRQTVHQNLNINKRLETQTSRFANQIPRVELRAHPRGNYSQQSVPYVILHYPDGSKETKVFRTTTEWIVRRSR